MFSELVFPVHYLLNYLGNSPDRFFHLGVSSQKIYCCALMVVDSIFYGLKYWASSEEAWNYISELNELSHLNSI